MTKRTPVRVFYFRDGVCGFHWGACGSRGDNEGFGADVDIGVRLPGLPGPGDPLLGFSRVPTLSQEAVFR